MATACKKREEWFTKEIQGKKKKEAALQKKLAQFDKPKEEAKETPNKITIKGGKKLSKKEQEAEAARLKAEEEEKKRKEAEAAKLKAEEDERKRKEEEEKKAKEKKPPAKGKGKEEKVEEHVEESEE